MKNAPCARFGIRIRPKISEKPDDNRNSRPPKATLFSVWMIQNCHCIDPLPPGVCPLVPDAMQRERQRNGASLIRDRNRLERPTQVEFTRPARILADLG